MKTSRRFSAAALALVLSLAAFAQPPSAAAQSQQYGALERGYRTGYSDGYQSGWTDQLKGVRADYSSKQDYASADRAYIAAYGSVEDYRDGYQQGFEAGYGAGYGRQGFNSDLPEGGITRRGVSQRVANRGADPAGSVDDSEVSTSQGRGSGRGSGVVPSNVVLTVELRNRLSTDVSQRGDRFEAQVVEPQEFAGAVVAGRLSEVQRAGKSRGRALLQLDFDQIRMPGGGGFQEFSAQVVEVLPGGETGAAEVDPEGGVRGKSTTKEDVAKVGAAAGVGAIIGGGAGTAGVMTQRGNDIRLEPGQQLRIRVTGQN